MKASIIIITYNHEQWIADAIDGALMQVADFDSEIVIGEDCSTDGTAEIVQQYQRNHPDKIRVVTSSENVGGSRNFARTLDDCRGEFIAYIDGDDFWNDQNKLADQVAFLESHADHSASVTQASIEFYGRTDNRLKKHYALKKESYTADEVLASPSFAVTSSLVFRRANLSPMPHWFHDIAWGDRAVKGMLAKHGKFHCLQRKAVTYRCNNWGAWQKLREQGNAYIKQARETIDSHLATYQPITA